jgi:GDP-4-dehydro-6-deoxy-D-mannose reductase
MKKKELIQIKNKGLLIDPDNLDNYLQNFNNYEEEMERDMADPEYWKGRRVLVTGASGFVGSHLTDKLINLESEVMGLVRRHSVPMYKNITHIMKNISLFEGNLTDLNSLNMLMKTFEPEIILHLGAQSFVPTSFRVPIETYQINILGTANLLEAVRSSEIDVECIQVACSSEEYGLVYPNEVPITEENLLRPLSPYAASKVAVDIISRTHYKCYGTPVVVTRGFNHTGPRRGLQFVTSVISRQIAKMSLGMAKKVVLGNPDPIRDFTDVRDMIQGYLLCVEKGKKGDVYNLGQGYGISIKNLAILAAHVEKIKNLSIEIDKTRYRPAEVDILICDYSKAKNELGYRPRIPLIKSLSDNIEYFKNNPHLLDIEMH